MMSKADRMVAFNRRIAVIMLAAGAIAAMRVQAGAQTALPDVSVTPSAPQNPKGGDHMIGSEGAGSAGAKGTDNHTLDHLNAQLKRKVDQTNPAANDPPLDAKSADPKIGVVNIPGVQQQYGKNFGNSVVPFRPAPPVFTSPVGPRR
jgi:hypothetical protein